MNGSVCLSVLEVLHASDGLPHISHSGEDRRDMVEMVERFYGRYYFRPTSDAILAIGMLAVTMTCGRWLEVRLAPPAGRLAGVVFMSALLLVGLILLFYRETSIA